MAADNEEYRHPIFVRDPDEWMQYVYKKVRLVTDDLEEHEGWVYTVDPVSQNFVLVHFSGEHIQLSIIMHHSITKTTVLEDSSQSVKQRLDMLFRPKAEAEYSAEELCMRKEMLKLWLERNRLPVEVTGSNGEVLTISNALMIQPPYRAEDCHSTNEIILARIQALIRSMPSDLKQMD